MSVTLKDIAQKAGVSISTVSRIVNNDQSKSASRKTTEKVWELVRELGYVPNTDARNLIKNTKSDLPQLNKTIGCILTSQKDSYRDPFFSQIMMGIQSEAALHGYVVGYTLSYSEDQSLLYQHIASTKMDGAIVLGRMSEDLLNLLKNNIKNFVYAGLNRVGRDFDEVICDAYDATCSAVSHLISLGHKKIGYIGGIPSLSKNNVINEHRFAAFKDTLEKNNIPLYDNYIKNINLSSKEGFDAMSEIIISGDLPSAIFCGNDIVAIGAMKAIHKKGIRIPKDISVVGLDNIEVAEYVRPSLTTIHVPKEELGRFAVKLLVDKINNGHEVNALLKLPFTLIIRESCGVYKND
jgi:DNA-binding LacI/PurR family transcriptional regulator